MAFSGRKEPRVNKQKRASSQQNISCSDVARWPWNFFVCCKCVCSISCIRGVKLLKEHKVSILFQDWLHSDHQWQSRRQPWCGVAEGLTCSLPITIFCNDNNSHPCAQNAPPLFLKVDAFFQISKDFARFNRQPPLTSEECLGFSQWECHSPWPQGPILPGSQKGKFFLSGFFFLCPNSATPQNHIFVQAKFLIILRLFQPRQFFFVS